MDINLKKILEGTENIHLEDGDQIRLFSISDVSDHYVEIIGGVNQPGIYELSEQLNNISDLINAANGLQDDVYLGNAVLTRTNDDSTTFSSVDMYWV